jgi:hypothetical protein
MIGLLQSGTGIGRGICLPIASSGSRARCVAVDRLAAPRPDASGPVVVPIAIAAPLPAGPPSAPAPLDPRAVCEPGDRDRPPPCVGLPLVALPAGVDADAAAVDPTAAAVAVLPWPSPAEDDGPLCDVPDPPAPGLVGVPTRGTSEEVPLGGLGVETGTCGVDTVTGGVEILTSDVDTFTSGVATVTAGVDTVARGVETLTLGIEARPGWASA